MELSYPNAFCSQLRVTEYNAEKNILRQTVVTLKNHLTNTEVDEKIFSQTQVAENIFPKNTEVTLINHKYKYKNL